MYSLLLPVEANPCLHLDDETGPPSSPGSSMDDTERCRNAATPARTPSLHEAIQSLAAETRSPAEVVRRVYESEFARLKDGARVNDFLVLLAMRRTRVTLRSLSRLAPGPKEA
jgi:hypothetical protein